MPSEVSVAGKHHDRVPTVEELRRDLAETLRREAATANLLKVISRAQFDLQAILDAIAEDAVKVCRAERASIFLCDGGLLHATAGYNVSANLQEFLSRNPIRPGSNTATARCALMKESVQIEDVRADPEYTYAAKDVDPMRTVLAVPMLTGEELLGVIVIFRHTIQPFTTPQVRLLETFADQAAIAVNGARAFHEAQGRAQDQEATSAILNIISQSRGVLQPVIDLIANTSCKLCQADFANVFLKADDSFHLRAQSGEAFEFSVQAELATAVLRPGRETVVGRVAANRAVVHILDIQDDPDLTFFKERGVETRRTALGVPLIQQGHVVGVISVGRTHKVKPFTDRQIALVKTFADQAVIAIENTRLFEAEQASKRELQESLEQQTATSEVLSVISASPGELEPVFQAMLENATRICDAKFGVLQLYEDGGFRIGAIHNAPPAFAEAMARREPLMRPTPQHPFKRMVTTKVVVQIADLMESPAYKERDPGIVILVERASARTFLAVPMLKENEVVGVIAIYRQEVRAFTDKQVAVIVNFANQAVIAIENIRLLNELRESLRQLEIASQHKSQFVANMSHELRTPLAAILGYAELIQEGFYGPLPEKALDSLTRIRSNGKHLLGLINTVLDIAKIESGQFTLNMTEYAIESVVETVRSATESLAQNKKLVLTTDVAKSLPVGLGDEQRLTQVLLNLVGNAIKFTDVGEVQVTAKAVNGHFNVSVIDTGPGIPAEHQTRIFDQFHQVDSSNTKAKGGTGLGLAIAKQIVEMHGGRIWVESTLGKGSTFQMEIPARPK